MYFVYILYSKNIDLFYVGHTEDLELRLSQHNQGFFVDAFTKRTIDWTVFYSLKCRTKVQAIKIEHHIKRMKSRKYYQNLVSYPEIAEKLKLKYKD